MSPILPENDKTIGVGNSIPSGLQLENAEDLSPILTTPPSKAHHNAIIQPGDESEFTPRPPTKDNYSNPHQIFLKGRIPLQGKNLSNLREIL